MFYRTDEPHGLPHNPFNALDMAKLRPIGRLGYLDYVKVTEVFSMDRPTWP